MYRSLVLLLAAVAVLFQESQAIAGKWDPQWKQVDEAVNKGLPKTAIERLDPVIQGAMKEKAYPEAIKAIAKKIALEGNIEGNKPEEKITRLEAEIAKAPKEMAPVMNAILADWYWHYFQQNRWRFMQRTATTAPPSKDFTTWDLPRLFAQIDRQFTKALESEAELKAIPVAQYGDLLQPGTVPDTWRPTLYDFLAHQALEFYASGEQAAAKPEDAFELSAGSPIFSPAEEFVKWEVSTTDADSPVVKAIKLYQKLVGFHRGDADQAALLDADLERLIFGYNKAVGEEKNARYVAAWKQFVRRWGDHEISALARYRWALVLREEGDLVAAHDLADQGARAFAETFGGKFCYNLLQEIEAKSCQVTTERVWPLAPAVAQGSQVKLEVHYRNLTQIYFRAVSYDYVELLKSARNRPEYLDVNQRNALLAKKPDLQWSAKLPATADYQLRVEELPAPQGLKPGFYFLLSSGDPGFGPQNNQVNFTDVWVSSLAVVMRSRPGDGLIEGFVLDAISGEPLAGADVQAWCRVNWNSFAAGPQAKTDANGLFSLQAGGNQGCLVYVTFKDQQLSSANDYYNYAGNRKPQPYKRTVFFTDRSLYRPGQTIQYKGICIRVDQEADDYKVLGGEAVTVVFADVNNKEIAKQTHRSNDYGSFSGSFTAPRDRLMGRMTIRAEGELRGMTAVSVEEYKRPKFQVVLEPPKTAPRLNDRLSLQGKATAYTGAAIDGAKVRYRVVREVRYPIWWMWCYWWRSPQQTASQEIAHGTAVTQTDGTFQVEFVAKPDLSVPEQDEPTFHYAVYADVTDTAGETRSANRSVNVGYTALAASMTADEWLTEKQPVKIAVSTQTLDGEGQRAEGAVKVYRLAPPESVHRASLSGSFFPVPVRRGKMLEKAGKKPPQPAPDLSNPNSWELGEVVGEEGFNTDAAGKATLGFKLEAGAYRAVLATQDRFQKKVTALLPLLVLKPDAKRLSVKVPNLVAAPAWTLEPGQEFMALWGTGYDKARAYLEIEHRGKQLQAFWTEAGAAQQPIKQAVTEALRGGFTLRVTMVRENRAYLTMHRVEVPWSNKKLSVAWEHFVSKLEPGQRETWTAVITGPDAKHAAAEMVAALYDRSLDAYLPHAWPPGFGVFREDHSNLQMQFENMLKSLQQLLGTWTLARKDVQMTYRSFPADITANLWGYMYFGGKGGGMRGAALGAPPMAPMAGARRMLANGEDKASEQLRERDGVANRAEAKKAMKPATGYDQLADKRAGEAAPGQPQGPDLSQVSARKNLNETAFFFPHLLADAEGRVKMEFLMPEALTEWKFLAFAHDRDLRGGLLEDKAVTAKDLMVQPNPPRFLREGDVLEFTVKVANQSAARLAGSVRLALTAARTGKSADRYFGNNVTDRAFDIPAKESRSFSWRLEVPDAAGEVLAYKAVGSTGRVSDGEEGLLPILPRRILVTESLPLPIRGPATRKFDFTRLSQSGQSKTLKNETLTVQMVSNPSWYAVMALPYLMDFPYECTEQTFNRLYANALARHIAASDPKIRRIFDQWKGTPALDSPLEKNQDLKSVMLEETPWVRQAQAESQARRDVGILFDDNRLNEETARLLKKLAEQQMGDGAWPWFPGGPPNDYITLYITTGFGRLQHLGVAIDAAPAVKSLARLDGWIDQVYREILRAGKPEENHLSATIALYLYGRSFFLKEKPVAPQHQEAVDYFLGQARKYWLRLADRQSQAHLAVALKRFGDKAVPQEIMRSIKERSVSSEELGMFWRDLELSWWWFHAPIETQAMMIEAFDEVMNDARAVEECKVWLLKQKQTQDWKTSKATADAVYGLLLRGDNLLASDELVQVTLGQTVVKPQQVEAGTGFYEERFLRNEITPELGRITVKKLDQGVAWGSVHWQYLEDMAKVTAYQGTPLKLDKSLYTRRLTTKGPVLEPVKGPLAVGDELVVRIVLRSDRDMEYVHLKDQRASGTEPVNVLSSYKYQDGLGYYESTRDTASHFFIDYLPKGTYVFEYATRVVHKGAYQSGMATIQCMYAPEFNSHSESIPLVVQ
jgi:uncharacterized protein YfaS (alpha-2-macroglobulin family)